MSDERRSDNPTRPLLPPPPTASLVALVTMVLVLAVAVVRLRVADEVLIPVGYAIPLMPFVWLSDRRFLWGAAGCFVVISAIRFYRVLPEDSHFPSRTTSYVLQLIEIALVSGGVHVLIGLRRSLDERAAELTGTIESLSARDEEVARQNEELQSQTEELERQSEELRVTNEDLASREKTLEHLLALSRTLMNERTRERVLDHVCEALGYLMGSRVAASAITERAGGRMVVRCHHGLGPEGPTETALPLEQAFGAVVLNRGQTAYLEDLSLRPDLRTPQPKAGEPMRSVLATPLRLQGRPAGTLEVYSRQVGAWSEEHVALLESLAAQASIALEAADLFEDVDRERRRFEAVFRTLPIGIVVADADYAEVRVNPAAGQIFGLSTDGAQDVEAALRGWQYSRGGRTLDREEYPLARAVRHGEETPLTEYELTAAPGRRLTLLGSACPVRDKTGRIIGGVGAYADITERKGLERELDQRRREAEESAVRKTRFLAAVSHDIRTPANAINLMAELIRRASANPGMASEVPALAGELQSSATSLVSLVSDVLDLTRFDTGRVELNETEFVLCDAVAEEVRQQAAVAAAKGLELRTEVPDFDVVVRTDRVKLGRVLGNLIGNAIKFTAAGEVTVSVRMGSDRRAHVQVRDTGVGIEPDHLTRIFDEFFQLRNPERDATKGTGLGLTICKRLVDAMGGEIAVESAPNRGTTFTLVLPAHAVTIERPRTAVVDGVATEERLDGLPVLLVEDEHITRVAARRLLEAEGARVTEAATVAEALRALEEQPVRVLLLDLHLPDGSGQDVLRRLRERRPAELRTTLVLTGDVSEAVADEIRGLGADGLIAKPMRLETVLDAIRRGGR